MEAKWKNRVKALEDSFFEKVEREKIEAFKAKQKMQADREELRKVSGVENDLVLDKAVELQLSSQTFSALSLTPLVEVAWADGKIDKREREAILQASEKHGVESGSSAHKLLGEWLEKKPNEGLFEAWKLFMTSLLETLPEEARRGLEISVLMRAKQVAESAGGILGIGSKISPEEQNVLDKLANVFAKSGGD